MKTSGIYKIQSKKNPERIYIGSAVNLEARWRDHKKGLRANRHHSKKLQNHYNKHGEEDLIFSPIICCDKEMLITYEQFYIDAIDPYFNICKRAGNTLGQRPFLGRKQSEEAKRKISIANKGKRKGIKGKPLTLERIQHLREINTGKKRSLDIRLKISAAKKGKTHRGVIPSDEARKNMSIAQKGNKNALGAKRSPENILQMSLRRKGKPSPNKGVHPSDETIAKMLASRKRNRLLKEQLQKSFINV